MPIEMPKGLPFSVDTWTPSSKRKRHHFLTHAHRDHSVGILTHFSYPIYSTQLTKTIVLQQFPQLDDSLFVGIEVGQSVTIDDPDGAFCVSAFDANHCLGAVMFLFEGEFGNILHTGDCRLTPECVLNLPEKYIGKKGKEPRCRLDYVFLDCTFGNVPLDMPSKHFAIRQIINCIWKHPEAPVVYLTCNMLGQEEILSNVSQTFGSKIYADKSSNPGFYRALELTVPEILSQDPSSRFQLFDGFRNLHDRAKATLKEAEDNFQPEPLIIRPSTQWYAHTEAFSGTGSGSQKTPRINEAVKDQSGVWHVCYSMHSSRDELEWALELLAPKWVVSTTPNCRALELSYVKKHCSGKHIASDDPLWKILGITLEASLDADESIEEISCSLVEEPTHCFLVEDPTQTSTEFQVQAVTISTSQKDSSTEFQLQTVKISTSQKNCFSLSPPSKRPITLFGRARLGLQDSTSQPEEKKVVSIKDDPSHFVTNKTEQDLSIRKEDIIEVKYDKSSENKEELNVIEEQYEKSVEKMNELRKSAHPPIGSSEWFNEKLRNSRLVTNKTEQDSSMRKEDIIEVKYDKSPENKVEANVIEGQCVKSMEKNAQLCKSARSPLGSSKCFNDTFRKFYRSMNVPVPQPLPSLMELLNTTKRAKRRFQF